MAPFTIYATLPAPRIYAPPLRGIMLARCAALFCCFAHLRNPLHASKN